MPVETSVVIITLDRAALLRQALASLMCQRHPVSEVVVVDNGPGSDTAEVARWAAEQLPVRHCPEPRRGYGAARNRGLREASGEWLLFLDDDCLAEPDWTDRLLAPLQSGEAELVGGSRDCVQPGLAARLDYLSADAPVLHPALPRRFVSHLSTSNLAMARDTAARVGWFDERLSTCEDRDFCVRAGALGCRILYEPRALVHHQPPIHNLRDYFRRMTRYGRGTSEYFLLHREREALSKLFPSSPALRLLLLPALAALGSAYLVAKNWPREPAALWLSPLLACGQVAWHWGGFQAAAGGLRRQYR
jgi:GT2 family glycosyltransferase